MPTIFERVDALGIYTFDADRRAGQLRPLRAAGASANPVRRFRPFMRRRERACALSSRPCGRAVVEQLQGRLHPLG
jgi:hypothetical protein